MLPSVPDVELLRPAPAPSTCRVVYTSPMSSLFDVNGKVVLVTGGRRGIGEMIARGFVDAGAKVYISSRKADVGEALAKELSEHGSCTSLPADFRPRPSVGDSPTRSRRAKITSTSW